MSTAEERAGVGPCTKSTDVSGAPALTWRSQPRRQSGALWVPLIGAGSGLLYVAVHITQRAIQQGGTPGGDGLRLHLGIYIAATAGLFGLYAALLLLCRNGSPPTRRLRVLAIAIPLLFNAAFVLAAPSLSIDLLSYVAHGEINTTGGNPYVDPASSIAHTPLGTDLADYGWRPVHPVSPYGPLWTHVETAVVRVAGGLVTELLLLKLVAVAASLGCAALIWQILGRLHPRRRLLGTLAYLWNPVIVVEFAGEGHNDALMIFFVLLALALLVRRRGELSIAAMALGVLTKYLPLFLIPSQLVTLWRTRRSRGQWIVAVVVGSGVALCVAVLLFVPLWPGWEILTGIRLTGQQGHTGSTPTVLAEGLSRFLESNVAARAVSVLTVGAFLAYMALQTTRVRDQAGVPQAWAGISVAYLLLASPSYWPWYAAMPIALLALLSGGPALALLFTLSLGSRLAAPLDMLFVHGVVSRPTFLLTTWIAGLGIPLVLVVAVAVRRLLTVAGRARIVPTYDDAHGWLRGYGMPRAGGGGSEGASDGHPDGG